MGNPYKCFKLRSWLKEILLRVVRFFISFLTFVDETWEKVSETWQQSYLGKNYCLNFNPTILTSTFTYLLCSSRDGLREDEFKFWARLQAELSFSLKSQPYVHLVVISMLASKTMLFCPIKKSAPGMVLRLWACLVSGLQGQTAKFIFIILQTG